VSQLLKTLLNKYSSNCGTFYVRIPLDEVESVQVEFKFALMFLYARKLKFGHHEVWMKRTYRTTKKPLYVPKNESRGIEK
jgi:hypothetical protein